MNEAEVLFSHLLGCGRTQLYLNAKTCPGRAALRSASRVLKARIAGEPLQYILGVSEFMGLQFSVGRDVLIPRPETEILVEHCIGLLKESPEARVLEIGTGSGCIAVSLAKFCPRAIVEACDISAKALKTARKNAAANAVKVKFYASDLFSSVPPGARYDLIVSNPPYIASGDIPGLSPEVTCQPRISLDGGRDGLDFYRRIIPGSLDFLSPQGYMALEIGYGQDEKVKNILINARFFAIIDIVEDYNGIQRVVIAKKR